MKFSFTAFLLLISVYSCQAQFEKYSHIYPISEDANVRWISNYSKYETIRFEANPLIKFSFYNNFAKRLPDTTKLHAMAQYIDFGPQFRLYSEKSQPIKTPSYRIFLGTQHMFRLKTKNAKAVQLIGFAFQSGHYSNGQSKCTFAEDENDGGAICNAIYNSITDTTDLSALLNRKNGNYSMNLTEITVNYRFNTLGDSNYAKHAHSVSLGYEINHKGIFGVADVDLVSDADLELIGRHRINVKYEYALNFKLVKKSKISQRIRAKQTLEAIIGAHPHINPIRTETALTFYPLSTVSALGLSFSYIYGHDNYNFRLVDSGSQFTVGLTWDMFPPVKLKKG